jgi:hypothetical protein
MYRYVLTLVVSGKIAEINLNLLPIDDSVFDQLPIMEEEQINENAH